MTRWLLALAFFCSFLQVSISAQTVTTASADKDAQLKFAVYFSRHGVRSPTGMPEQYNQYSAAPWPAWDVAPGYLTAHGYHLMELFGAYDRMELANLGLFTAHGCSDSDSVHIYADSDQRTQETGRALAAGLFPGCAVPVQSLAEGTNDPFFHPITTSTDPTDSALAAAAIAGRIGNNPDNLTEAYRPQLAALDTLLATCGASVPAQSKRTSLFAIPSIVSPGKGDHLVEMKGPLNTASTLTENLLLEYTEGMDAANVGWGCVDGVKLQSLIELHTVATDFAQHTPSIAKAQASNLLDHIGKALEQAVAQRPIAGAQSKPTDRVLFLIGHDTNISNLAGLLNLTWIIDGRRDDTPPGGALVFELWRSRKSGLYSVRTYFTAQTLEQMRSAATLTLSHPPQRVPVFLPGCSKEDFSCTWPDFSRAIHQAVDPRYVNSK